MSRQKEINLSQVQADAIIGDSTVTENEQQTIKMSPKAKDWKQDRKARLKEKKEKEKREVRMRITIDTTSPETLSGSVKRLEEWMNENSGEHYNLLIVSGDTYSESPMSEDDRLDT